MSFQWRVRADLPQNGLVWSPGTWVFSTPQFKTSILRHSAFFIVQLSHPYMTTGKTTALTRWTFVGNHQCMLKPSSRLKESYKGGIRQMWSLCSCQPHKSGTSRRDSHVVIQEDVHSPTSKQCSLLHFNLNWTESNSNMRKSEAKSNMWDILKSSDKELLWNVDGIKTK